MNVGHGNTRGEFVNVTWTLGKSNKSPIKKVIIEHKTQFTPSTWHMIAEESVPEKGWTQIALSPWVRYTFRVVAVNEVGNSMPSAQSSSFQAPAAGKYFEIDLLRVFSLCIYCPCGRRSGLMVSALDSGSGGPGSSPGRGTALCLLS